MGDGDHSFEYREAFRRNLGLVTEQEQARLRRATVAIGGCGGVGGWHALTLARQGVGRFKLADFDRFSLANMNRQAGARMSTLGQAKAAVIREMILDINPEAHVELFEEGIDSHNVDAFLKGSDVYLDGIDFFAIEARRLLFAGARKRGLWSLTAGPLGFSAAFVAFSPRGMSFDEYCDFRPGMSVTEQLIAFAVALAPKGTHLAYMDMSRVDLKTGAAPSSGLACQLCSSILAAETIALLLGRREPEAAPAFAQFDPYRRTYERGRLWLGNRGPVQRLKRLALRLRWGQVGVIR